MPMKPTDALDILSDFKARSKDRLWQDVVRQNIAISGGAKFIGGQIVEMKDIRLEKQEEKILEIIEIQTGDYLGEDDIIRLEDDYQRS